MHICVFGASGRTGREIVKLALQDGHVVTALVRQKEKLGMSHSRLRVIEGNVLSRADVYKAVSSCENIVSALGTDGTNVLSESMPYILAAMEKEHIQRIVTIGTAGILQARSNPGVYRFQSNESRRKTTKAAEEHLRAYAFLQSSSTDWTIVCPTHLIAGEAKLEYRTERDMLPEGGTTISTGDTAHFAYGQLFHNQYIRARVGIAY